ncbi:hypothetical protein [Streptomyces sp. NPDC002205]|uniref:hypothetical protein n=1 Tax=Streptomyces sp. NPDC002205 TaxID=3154411 RepID=UPI0033216BC9
MAADRLAVKGGRHLCAERDGSQVTVGRRTFQARQGVVLATGTKVLPSCEFR